MKTAWLPKPRMMWLACVCSFSVAALISHRELGALKQLTSIVVQSRESGAGELNPPLRVRGLKSRTNLVLARVPFQAHWLLAESIPGHLDP